MLLRWALRPASALHCCHILPNSTLDLFCWRRSCDLSVRLFWLLCGCLSWRPPICRSRSFCFLFSPSILFDHLSSGLRCGFQGPFLHQFPPVADGGLLVSKCESSQSTRQSDLFCNPFIGRAVDMRHCF